MLVLVDLIFKLNRCFQRGSSLGTDNEDVGNEEVSELSNECKEKQVKELNVKLHVHNKAELNQSAIFFQGYENFRGDAALS